jgi:hypothetical protein
MPNWKQIVRKKLRVFGICSPEFTEELAAHLEDSYEALRCEGLPAEEAFEGTIGQIDDRCRVRLVMCFLQEEFMTGFIPKVVLPGLVTAAAACLFYWALLWDHISPKIIWLVGGQLPTLWWCLLPLCGVLGALLSQRNGRSRLQRMAASLLPSAILCTLVLIIFVVGFTMSGFVNHYQFTAARLESLGLVPPGFGVIPAALSLLGAEIAEVSSKKFRRLA